jgi:hypothetical protein
MQADRQSAVIVDVCLGSWLCENARTLDRDRTSKAFKTVCDARIGSPFNFEVERKNIFLVALRNFEFSHSQSHKRPSESTAGKSALGGGFN